jgi:hypothetical protein
LTAGLSDFSATARYRFDGVTERAVIPSGAMDEGLLACLRVIDHRVVAARVHEHVLIYIPYVVFYIALQAEDIFVSFKLKICLCTNAGVLGGCWPIIRPELSSSTLLFHLFLNGEET